MSEPKLAIQTLSQPEGIERLQAFFNSMIEQGQFTPDEQLALVEQLQAGVEKRDELGNCVFWVEGQAAFLREKEKQLAERRRHFEKFAEMLRSSLHQAMLDLGVRRVEGNEFVFAIKKNPPRVEIMNEEKIPPEFFDYRVTIDKEAIKNTIQDGKQVPGAELVSGTRLDIR
jgi:hypothetical protein